jgi:hypothetical protein
MNRQDAKPVLSLSKGPAENLEDFSLSFARAASALVSA